MRFSLCTISFRHQLISFQEISSFARKHRFDGIEMWGIHGERLYEHARHATELELSTLRREHIHISMLSDYLNIDDESEFRNTVERCDRLIQLAVWLGSPRIRTFAGQKSSKAISKAERERYIERLLVLCDRCSKSGVQLIVEIHPGTLADSLSSTMELLHEVGKDKLRLNFDVMHVWEFGGDIMEHYEALEKWVDYFHLKNVTSANDVGLFEPENVYAASGKRQGMSRLRDGIIDYCEVLKRIENRDCYAALEWFGPDPLKVLEQEINWLHGMSLVGNNDLKIGSSSLTNP